MAVIPAFRSQLCYIISLRLPRAYMVRKEKKKTSVNRQCDCTGIPCFKHFTCDEFTYFRFIFLIDLYLD